jgi:hypothetical protein
MTRQEAIARVCRLTELVNSELFHHKYPSDCFCGEGGYPGMTFQNSGVVLAFIEQAVRDALARACLKREARRQPGRDIFGDETEPQRGLVAAMREIRKRTRRPLP